MGCFTNRAKHKKIYQILASNLEEAIEIGKAVPRFDDGDWRLEVRPIMKVDGIN